LPEHWIVSSTLIVHVLISGALPALSQGDIVFIIPDDLSIFRDDYGIIWPSIGTACNKHQYIEDDEMLEQLTNEFDPIPIQTILQTHFATRLRNSSKSGLKITKILAMKVYVNRYDWI